MLDTFFLVLSANAKCPFTVTDISKLPCLGGKATQPGEPGSHHRGHFCELISSIPLTPSPLPSLPVAQRTPPALPVQSGDPFHAPPEQEMPSGCRNGAASGSASPSSSLLPHTLPVKLFESLLAVFAARNNRLAMI